MVNYLSNIKHEYFEYVKEHMPDIVDDIYNAMIIVEQYTIRTEIFDCSYFEILLPKTLNIIKKLIKYNVQFKKENYFKLYFIKIGLNLLLDYVNKNQDSVEIIYNNREKILSGDFSFKEEVTYNVRTIINKFEFAYEVLGPDTVLDIVEDHRKYYDIIRILKNINPQEKQLNDYSNYLHLSFSEAIKYDKYKEINNDKYEEIAINYYSYEVIHMNKDNILYGDFSFKFKVSENIRTTVDKYEFAYKLLGSEVVFDIVNNKGKYYNIIDILKNLSREYRVYDDFLSEVWELSKNIPNNLLYKPAYGFIKLILSREEADYFLKMADMKRIKLGSLPLLLNMEMLMEAKLIWKIYSNCNIDVSKKLENLINELHKNEMRKIVLDMRSRNYTLDQIGQKYEKTRERVRQIELKAKRAFNLWDNKNKILLQISALLDSKQVISEKELEFFLGEYSKEIFYLLKVTEQDYYSYIPEVDSFILCDKNMLDEAKKYVDKLADIIDSQSIETSAENSFNQSGIDKDIFNVAIQLVYRKVGNVYCKSSLYLSKIYLYIIEKYYPNGIALYEDEVMIEFRNRIKDDFGDDYISSNDRAIRARIMDNCIMCGKGKYMVKKESYISNGLFLEIESSIDNDEKSVIIISSVYSQYEDKLLLSGVDNRYYLQGILKEKLSDRFSFTRDYIFKNSDVSSFYQEVVNYIKKFDYPITKKQIFNNFQGITEIVLNYSVCDENIINFFGEYLHGSKLNLNDEDIKYLYNIIMDKLKDGEIHHIKEFFEIVSLNNIILLNKAGLFQSFSFFSTLEYLFRDEIQFLRPYIAMNNVQLTKSVEIISELVKSREIIKIKAITKFAKDIGYQVNNILELMNSYNNTHLLINSKSIATFDYIGINEDIINEVEYIITSDLKNTTLISHLSCLSKLPKLNVLWTDWLIYSILFKWGKKTEVAVTNNYFQYAHPVVSIKGEMDLSFVKIDDILEASDLNYKIDDLDNIDDLIVDIIEDELFEELL